MYQCVYLKTSERFDSFESRNPIIDRLGVKLELMIVDIFDHAMRPDQDHGR